MTTGNGRYTITPASAVITVAHAVTVLTADITAELGAPAKVSCGPKPVLVLDAGGSFSCVATVAGLPRAVSVTVIDLQGHLRYNLAPPAAG